MQTSRLIQCLLVCMLLTQVSASAAERAAEAKASKAAALLEEGAKKFRAAQENNQGGFYSRAHLFEGSARELLAQAQTSAEGAQQVRSATADRFRQDAGSAASAFYDLGLALAASGDHAGAVDAFDQYLRWMAESNKTMRWSFPCKGIQVSRHAYSHQSGFLLNGNVIYFGEKKYSHTIDLVRRQKIMALDIQSGKQIWEGRSYNGINIALRLRGSSLFYTTSEALVECSSRTGEILREYNLDLANKYYGSQCHIFASEASSKVFLLYGGFWNISMKPAQNMKYCKDNIAYHCFITDLNGSGDKATTLPYAGDADNKHFAGQAGNTVWLLDYPDKSGVSGEYVDHYWDINTGEKLKFQCQQDQLRRRAEDLLNNQKDAETPEARLSFNGQRMYRWRNGNTLERRDESGRLVFAWSGVGDELAPIAAVEGGVILSDSKGVFCVNDVENTNKQYCGQEAALHEKARSLICLGRLDDGITTLEMALHAAPFFNKARQILVETYKAKGKVNRALREASRFYDLADPADSNHAAMLEFMNKEGKVARTFFVSAEEEKACFDISDQWVVFERDVYDWNGRKVWRGDVVINAVGSGNTLVFCCDPKKREYFYLGGANAAVRPIKASGIILTNPAFMQIGRRYEAPERIARCGNTLFAVRKSGTGVLLDMLAADSGIVVGSLTLDDANAQETTLYGICVDNRLFVYSKKGDAWMIDADKAKITWRIKVPLHEGSPVPGDRDVMVKIGQKGVCWFDQWGKGADTQVYSVGDGAFRGSGYFFQGKHGNYHDIAGSNYFAFCRMEDEVMMIVVPKEGRVVLSASNGGNGETTQSICRFGEDTLVACRLQHRDLLMLDLKDESKREIIPLFMGTIGSDGSREGVQLFVCDGKPCLVWHKSYGFTVFQFESLDAIRKWSIAGE